MLVVGGRVRQVKEKEEPGDLGPSRRQCLSHDYLCLLKRVPERHLFLLY